jgi:hypothetical protein
MVFIGEKCKILTPLIEYKGAKAKIVVYYPKNQLKILGEEPFT